MEMYTYLIIGTIFWTLLSIYYYYASDKMSKKSRNFINFTHAVGIILAYLIGLNENYIYKWSVSYYAYDIIQNIINMSNLFQIGMLFHHIITIYILNFLEIEQLSSYIIFGFYLTELSNLPMYITKYFNYINCNPLLMKFMTILEILFFGYFRFYLGNKILYKIYSLGYINYTFFVPVIILEILNLFWLNKLKKQIF